MSNKVQIGKGELLSLIENEVRDVLSGLSDLDNYPRHVQDAVVTLDAEVEGIEKTREGYKISIPATEFNKEDMRKLGRRGIRARNIEQDGNTVHVTISD